MRSMLSAGLKKLVGTEPTFAPGNRNATVIAVAAQKGGVGKTTTSVNLACALALDHDRRVLIIDADAQGHVGASLGVTAEEQTATLSEILISPIERDLLEAVVQGPLPNLHITPPDPNLSEAEPILNSRVGREMILQGAIQTARSHYDTILIDCPPNLGNLTLNALLAADRVLVPCDMSSLAVNGVASILNAVDTVDTRLRHEIGIAGIVRTRVDNRNTRLNAGVDASLRHTYPHLLLNTIIPINSALAQAQAEGESILTFAPRSTGAAAYRSLADELLGRLENRRATRARL